MRSVQVRSSGRFGSPRLRSSSASGWSPSRTSRVRAAASFEIGSVWDKTYPSSSLDTLSVASGRLPSTLALQLGRHRLRDAEHVRDLRQALAGRPQSPDARQECRVALRPGPRGLPPFLRDAFPDLSTDAQRSLQVVRSSTGITTALVGMRREEHVDENLELAQHARRPRRRSSGACSKRAARTRPTDED